MATQIARFLSASAIQGSADSYKETAITTELIPANGFAFSIKKMEFCLADTGATLIQNVAQRLLVALSRDTKAAMPELSDADVLYKKSIDFGAVTSGGLEIERSFEYAPAGGLFIVEPTIYLQFDTTATSIANTLYARIFYEEIKLSEVEILRLLNNA